MNNEELKKKIISALQSVEFVTEKGWCGQCISLRLDYSAIADALIAAGIGDVKEAEHRAEVAQLIAERACELVFSEEINDEDWVNVIFNYKKEKGIREIGITTNILYDYLKDQAEKELAEKEKDD